MPVTVIDMTGITAKKHSVRFDCEDKDSPVSSIYIARHWLTTSGNDDALIHGVRVTIEPLAEVTRD